MHDAVAMRDSKRVSYLCGVLKGLRDRQRGALQTCRERFALDELHDEEASRQAIVVADVMERADVWMIQAGERSRLALKALLSVWAIRQLRP
jgi:hypothetical protein